MQRLKVGGGGFELAERAGASASAGPAPAAKAYAKLGAGAAAKEAAARRGLPRMASKRHPEHVAPGWRSGPADPSGVLCDLSDRPSLCSAVHWGRSELVIGSSDHALYVVDTNTCTKKRTLYSKTSGHGEWVTTVAFCPDGKIVSGGMDSKLFLWPSGSSRGYELAGHSAPIAKVVADPSTGLVASASYDKSIRLWDVSTPRGRESSVLKGHAAPVMELGSSESGRMASGDRSGHLIIWDLTSATASWRNDKVHGGHITSLAWFDESDPTCGGLVLSGGQDGHLRVWDPRSKGCVAEQPLHMNERGVGALGDILAGGPAAAGMVVTAGADGTVRILDPHKSFALCSTVKLTNFPYSLSAAGGLALVGCGDGSLHVVDIVQGSTLYAIGANKAAVRTIDACANKLLCSGDDGNVVMWQFL